LVLFRRNVRYFWCFSGGTQGPFGAFSLQKYYQDSFTSFAYGIGILIVISNYVPLTRNLMDVHIVSPEISNVLDNDGTAYSLAGTEMGTSWLGASVASVTRLTTLSDCQRGGLAVLK
jgi:hypothetical protein